jgi:hypothetical protein
MFRVAVVMAVVTAFAASCASTSGATSVVTAQPKLVGLADILPGDLDPTADCASSKDPTPKGVVGLTDQLNCVEGAASQIAGGYVDAYLFESLDSLRTSFAEINTTYNFFPGSAGAKCPPKNATAEGKLTWHQSEATGTLECYSTSDGGHVYIWTNEPDQALFFAKVGKAISFAKLHLWWTRTGCCS